MLWWKLLITLSFLTLEVLHHGSKWWAGFTPPMNLPLISLSLSTMKWPRYYYYYFFFFFPYPKSCSHWIHSPYICMFSQATKKS
jgi:hypothetical protein